MLVYTIINMFFAMKIRSLMSVNKIIYGFEKFKKVPILL